MSLLSFCLCLLWVTNRNNPARLYAVAQRDGMGRVLQAATAVLNQTQLTETLAWRNDGRLSAYTAIRSGDFTDSRTYTYSAFSQRLTQETFGLSSTNRFTNNYTFDQNQPGGIQHRGPAIRSLLRW